VLDLLEEHGALMSPGFRHQLDRAALSISNNIAEGFERVTTNELLAFLAIARGSAGEVRSMLAVVKNRQKLKRMAALFQHIRESAESCSRQLTAWAGSIENSPIQGKRHLTPATRAARNAIAADGDFRRRFLLSLTPEHPLYSSPEAITARGKIADRK
jgi:four helix bundle protein